MLSSKDLNFVGYTYKNFEPVNDDEVLEMGTVYFLLSLNNFVCLFHFCHLFLLQPINKQIHDDWNCVVV
jgi:hypothetical protein